MTFICRPSLFNWLYFVFSLREVKVQILLLVFGCYAKHFQHKIVERFVMNNVKA